MLQCQLLQLLGTISSSQLSAEECVQVLDSVLLYPKASSVDKELLQCPLVFEYSTTQSPTTCDFHQTLQAIRNNLELRALGLQDSILAIVSTLALDSSESDSHGVNNQLLCCAGVGGFHVQFLGKTIFYLRNSSPFLFVPHSKRLNHQNEDEETKVVPEIRVGVICLASWQRAMERMKLKKKNNGHSFFSFSPFSWIPWPLWLLIPAVVSGFVVGVLQKDRK